MHIIKTDNHPPIEVGSRAMALAQARKLAQQTGQSVQIYQQILVATPQNSVRIGAPKAVGA